MGEGATEKFAEVPPASGDNDHRDNFSRNWDQRVVVMVAVLAARDYEGADRAEIVAWALSILQAAADEDEKYHGNEQIEYNAAAIAALGLIALFERDREVVIRDALLRIASRQDLAVIKSLGNHLPALAKIDARIPRAVLRIVMVSSIHPRRDNDERRNLDQQNEYRRKIEATIVAERRWLGEVAGESAWPELPARLSRPPRSMRIGRGVEKDDELADEIPDQYLNEHVLGAMVRHLAKITLDELPAWIVALARHLMDWTVEANGPQDEEALDGDHRPDTWNDCFFEFAGILSAALPHAEVVQVFLDPITRFKDETFHNAMAAYLRGFDRAVLAIETNRPKNPVAVRTILADRIRKGRNFQRYRVEKSFTSETHAARAMTALFFQPSPFGAWRPPIIPEDWNGLDEVMPILTALVAGAPCSGYLATLFLNIVETSPRAPLVPFVIQATAAWCSAYGIDTNFWSEKEMGGRVCAWLDRTFTADLMSSAVTPGVIGDLIACLDILIRSGVAQAREVEDRIVAAAQNRKSA